MRAPSSSCRARRGRSVAAATLAVALVAGCGSADRDPGPAVSAAPRVAATDEPTPPAVPTPPTPVDDLFHVLSPWNTLVADDPVQPGSAGLLARSGGAAGGVLVDAERPVSVVTGGVPTTLTCRRLPCGEGGTDLVLDVPAEVDPDPLDDGRFTVLDPAAGIGYDFWRARREPDGTISFHAVHTWDLDGPGFNQPYVDSVRGSGLPLFAGLIRPDELARGRIDHALAIGLPAPAADYFVQPASTTDGVATGEPAAVPEGARLRLRADVSLPLPADPVTGVPLPLGETQRRHADLVVRTLQQYGAIVVGRADVPTLYVEAGETGLPGPLAGYELQSLRLADFEVVGFGDLTRFPAEGSAP